MTNLERLHLKAARRLVDLIGVVIDPDETIPETPHALDAANAQAEYTIAKATHQHQQSLHEKPSDQP